MKNLYTFFTCLIVGIFPLYRSAIVYADSYGSYEQPQQTDLTVNKEVKNPVSSVFVEHLGSTDPAFSPDSFITFKLIVKNTSGETMNPASVVDTLPIYLTFVGASVPAIADEAKKVVTIKLENVIAGETREVELTAKVAPASAFPKGRSFFCVSNYAKITSPSRPNGDDDTSDFCIQTNVGGAQYLPVAGFNDIFTVIPFLSLAGIGLVLLKKKV